MHRSIVLMCLLPALVPLRANAQSPHTERVLNIAAPGGGPAPNNPWYAAGFQLGHRLAGSGDFADDLVASGRAVLSLKTKTIGKDSTRVFGLPLIGNIGKLRSKVPDDIEGLKKEASKLLATTEGINVGVYPYWELRKARSTENAALGLDVTFYLSGTGRINQLRDRVDTTQTFMLMRGRLSAGFDFGIRHKDFEQPISISSELAVSLFSADRYLRAFGDRRSNIVSVDVTAIIPIGGFGLLAEGSFASRLSPNWRIGIIVAKASQSKG
jgi:hypothetical protein